MYNKLEVKKSDYQGPESMTVWPSLTSFLSSISSLIDSVPISFIYYYLSLSCVTRI